MPDQPTLGQIMPTAFAVVPRGWHLCDGAILDIAKNQALFSLFGTRFGGDGVRTFALPDLRGRAVLGASSAQVMGAQNGTATVTLTDQQLPSHSHALAASKAQGSGRGASPVGRLFGTNTAPGGQTIFGTAGSNEVKLAPGANVFPNGSNQPHNNMQPFLAINYLVAIEGIYPSRN